MDDELLSKARSSKDSGDRASHRLPSLSYVLLTPGKDDGYTPFQAFGADITHPAFPMLIGLLSMLPMSVVEIFSPLEALPDLRRPWTTKRGTIAGLPSFLALQQRSEEDVIRIIIGLPDEIETAIKAAGSPKPIFVTTEPLEGAIALKGYQGHPAQFLDSVLRDELLARLEPRLRADINERPLRPAFQEGTEPSRVAGVTQPNETLSESLGYVYAGATPIDPLTKDAYVDAILDSAHRARAIIGEESTDTVLYAPSLVRHLYAFGSTFWNNLLRKVHSRELREMIKDGVFRNPDYSGFVFASNGDPERLNPYDDPAASAMLATRQIELYLTVAGIGALAAQGMQPALRLPNAVNFHAATLREIERHADRDDARGQALLRRNYTKLAQEMYGQIHPRLIDDLRSHTEAITLVADAPLEWLRIDGLPLMIRHELSRIGMTPGNLMLAQCVQAGTIGVRSSALTDVLVIRSFKANDHLRDLLEVSVRGFHLKRMQVRFVDVAKREDLIAALNAFSGAIVVFDCHGGHGGEDSHGWLRIGNEKLNVWELAHSARIPPIVVLSACSTFALAGSHASVANGLIRSGAVTVIGTFLPVEAVRSAIFVARLLFRIDQFLPILKHLGVHLVTWRSLVSTFLRMSYATDLLRFFISEKQWLDQSMLTRIGNKANYDINRLHPRWYERFLRRLARAARREISDIQTVIDTESPLVETMYYCQTGRPETIVILLD